MTKTHVSVDKVAIKSFADVQKHLQDMDEHQLQQYADAIGGPIAEAIKRQMPLLLGKEVHQSVARMDYEKVDYDILIVHADHDYEDSPN